MEKFLNSHQQWPRTELIEKNIEYTLKSDEEVLAYFSDKAPLTAYGKYQLAKAKFANNINDPAAIDLIRSSWPQLTQTLDEQKKFIHRYRNHLKNSDYHQRVNALLWNSQITLAKGVLTYLPRAQRNVYYARIGLMQNKRGVNKLIDRLTVEELQSDGFLYARSRWHLKRENYSRIYGFLEKITKPSPYAKKWWNIRKRVVREFLEQKKYRQAYHLSKHHGTEPGSIGFAEGEWLAGWLALRFLKQPKTAYRHFYSMYKNVKYPISKSRASYWAGRAAAANNNHAIAKRWYKINEEFPYTFYGQLALQEIQKNSVVTSPPFPKISKKTKKKVDKRSLVKAAVLLLKSKEGKWSKTLLNHAVKESKNKSEIAYLTMLGLHHKMPHLSVEASNEASRRHQLFLAKTAFPTLNNIADKTKDLALTHAIIRQESRFNTLARSSANARGLMQLLPSTARRTARQLHIRYNTLKLTRDPQFNIQVGSYYIHRVRERFDGSYILGIAAYNAGPTNVKRWLKRFGNPLESQNLYDVIDWMELIPFSETRNYVQRVLENMQVYQKIFSPDALISLSSTLTYRQTPQN
jgi:soluble lytic murein transglycosylase